MICSVKVVIPYRRFGIAYRPPSSMVKKFKNSWPTEDGSRNVGKELSLCAAWYPGRGQISSASRRMSGITHLCDWLHTPLRRSQFIVVAFQFTSRLKIHTSFTQQVLAVRSCDNTVWLNFESQKMCTWLNIATECPAVKYCYLTLFYHLGHHIRFIVAMPYYSCDKDRLLRTPSVQDGELYKWW